MQTLEISFNGKTTLVVEALITPYIHESLSANLEAMDYHGEIAIHDIINALHRNGTYKGEDGLTITLH